MDSERIRDKSVERLGGLSMTVSGPKPPTQGTRARAMAHPMPVTNPGTGTTSETWSSQGSWVLKLVTLLALLCLLPSARGSDISCQGIRYMYFNKGLDTSNIPRTPQQGERLITFFGPKNGAPSSADNTFGALLSRVPTLYPISPISHKKW